MIVHITTSKRSLVDHIEQLRGISKVIHDRGHSIAGEWIETAYASAIQSVPYDLDATYHKSMDQVAKAEVTIAEVSNSSFGVGYQVAMAIQQKKPVLLLARAGGSPNALIKGLDNDVVQYREYTPEDLYEIVADFLDENDIQAQDLRFNFFIDRPTYNYLRWTSQKTGKTKAKILRELVQKEIQQSED